MDFVQVKMLEEGGTTNCPLVIFGFICSDPLFKG
jgi:hypothetical protein